jgi:hypothetical protein
MAVVELFSKRQKKLKGEVVEVYTYEVIDRGFRVQVIHILNDVVGQDFTEISNKFYEFIHETLCKEYGLFTLHSHHNSNRESVHQFLLKTEAERVIDTIELCFRIINYYAEKDSYAFPYAKVSAEEAIEELNYRFLENGIGYQFEGNSIIRLDSKILHSEVVKPTLILLSNNDYAGAQEEFLNAHEHYRQGRNKECLVDSLKSFESVMKTICTKRGWVFNQTDPAKKLLDVLFANGLIPSFMQSQFDGLRVECRLFVINSVVMVRAQL